MQGNGRASGFRARKRSAGWQTVCILSLLLVGIGLSVLADSGIEIRDISVRRVEIQSSETVQNLDDNIVLVGDQLHVRAVVANTSAETLSRLRVDFYFTETLTNEHGLLGSQTVFSLAPGEERLPAISVATDGFTPGRYIITAAVALQDGTEYLDSYTSSADDASVVRVNGLGPAIAEISPSELTSSFRASQFGGLDDTISIKLFNVGTSSFGNITIGVFPQLPCVSDPIDVASSTSNPDTSFVRFTDVSTGILDLQVVAILGDNRERVELPLTKLTLGGSEPGDTMRLIASFCTDPLDTYYQPEDAAMASFEVLGQPAVAAEPLSIELSFRPGETDGENVTAGATRKLVLPSDDTKATVYSELDLWQFPLPDDSTQFGVPTVMPALRPTALSSEFLFHITQQAQGDGTTTYALHVLNPEDGDVYASLDLDAAPLTDPLVLTSAVADRVFDYRVYLGMATGQVEVYTLTVDKSNTSQDPVYTWTVGNTSGSWQTVSNTVDVSTAARPTTYLQLGEATKSGATEPSNVIVVSGAKGIYVLDADTGAFLNGIADSAVTTRPAIADDYVWYAQGSAIHSAPLIASADAVEYCTPVAGRSVTTPLVYQDGVLFWGTSNGGVGAHIIGSDCDITAGRREVTQLGDIVGIALGTDTQDNGDPIVFVTGRSGGIASFEFNLSDSYPSFQKIAESTSLVLLGEDEPHTLSASLSTTLRSQILAPIGAPTILDVADPQETVFVVAQFEAVVGVNTPTNHWALVALNGSTFTARKAVTWGKSVSYVLKMDEDVDLLLEPVVVPSGTSKAANTIVVVVPGDRLYALSVKSFSE